MEKFRERPAGVSADDFGFDDFTALQSQLSTLRLSGECEAADPRDEPKFSEREMRTLALRALNVEQRLSAEIAKEKHRCLMLDAKAAAHERLHKEALSREAALKRELEATKKALQEAQKTNYALMVHVSQFGKRSEF